MKEKKRKEKKKSNNKNLNIKKCLTNKIRVKSSGI